MPCDTCNNRFRCRFQASFQALYFFTMLTEPEECLEYDPARYHGIEGVAA